MMKFAVAFAVVAIALAAERPKVADEFIAEVEVERTTHEGEIFGEGFIAHDQEGRKAAERYDLRPSKYHVLHVLNLERADLRKDFEISSEDARDCNVRDFSGTLRNPFQWVENATYVGQIKHHEVTLDAWELKAGGIRLAVGVGPDDVNRPVVFERETPDSFERFFFRDFKAERPEEKYFAIPQECQSQSLKAPDRPRIPESFLAAADVERQEHDHTIYGEGFFAHDQPGQKAAERYDLHETQYKIIHVHNVERGDLHEEFSVNSEDPKQCYKRNLTRPIEPVFAWIAKADYIGTVKHHEVVLDAWEYRVGGSRLLLGVTPSDNKTPVVFEREHSGELSRFHFLNFTGMVPEDKYFEVPEGCQ